MHIYFSGIGGTGIGPLALIAHQAGHSVSGSDKQDSQYIHYLKKHGIDTIHIGQDTKGIEAVHEHTPIDWLVYSSAVAIEQPDNPEFVFCHEHDIRMTPRAALLNEILAEKDLQMIAIAGTQGKSTTTAMAVWLFKQLAIPIGYSFGAKTSFSDMGAYEEGSRYFVYEADEFARNFLEFRPKLSIITGVDYDHPDIYPTREAYEQAFRDFLEQSQQAVVWESDFAKLGVHYKTHISVLHDNTDVLNMFSLVGDVNRRNALQVVTAVHNLTGEPAAKLIGHINNFPGLSRRFEQLVPNLYSDYAHTPPKIRGAIQTAHEVAGENVVVIYEGLHNTRQHFIKAELVKLFDDVKQLYVVPSYLAREDPNLPLLSPANLINLLSDKTRDKSTPMQLDDSLKTAIQGHLDKGDLVLCLTAGGGNSLDEWLREKFKA
ncbi:MAG: Mur ligase domain-containing protein [Candidatus Saccharimonadales bacterium]